MFQLAVRLWTEGGLIYPAKFSVMYDVNKKASSVRAFVKNDKFISTEYMLITPFFAVNGPIFEKDIIVVDNNYDIMRFVEFNLEEGVYQAININDDSDILLMTAKHIYETAGNVFEDGDLVEGTKYALKKEEDVFADAASKPDTEETVTADNEKIKHATKSDNPENEANDALTESKKPENKNPKDNVPKDNAQKQNHQNQQNKQNNPNGQNKPQNQNQNQQQNKKDKNNNDAGKETPVKNEQKTDKKPENKNQELNNNQVANDKIKNNTKQPASVQNKETPMHPPVKEPDFKNQKNTQNETKPETKSYVNTEVKTEAKVDVKEEDSAEVKQEPVNEAIKKTELAKLSDKPSEQNNCNSNLSSVMASKEAVKETPKETKATGIEILKENSDGQMSFFTEPDESDYFNEPKKEVKEEKSALKNTSEKPAKAELYFTSDCAGKNGSYVFSVLSRGMEETFFGEEENTDSKKISLQGLIDSLSSFDGNFNVTVFTDSQYVVYPFIKGWINKWKNSNWYKNDTDRIQNFELWAQLLELSNKHNVRWEFIVQPTEQMIKCMNILKVNKK